VKRYKNEDRKFLSVLDGYAKEQLEKATELVLAM
jgi:hypothetical protein